MFGLGIKEKEKKRRKKTNKGWLKLQKQEREENGVERQIYIPKASTRFRPEMGPVVLPDSVSQPSKVGRYY